jgi:hypothetical protein
MDAVLQSLTQHQAATLLALSVGLFFAVLFSLWVLLKLLSYQKRWRHLMGATSGPDLEQMLHDHLHERLEANATLRALEDRVSRTEDLLRTSKRFLGLVRFDAFPDVGGSQSFALAVFDDNGDGAILSSIVGRTTCRVYCKPIVGGRSERDLSQEEQRAMKSAAEGGVRMILSP